MTLSNGVETIFSAALVPVLLSVNHEQLLTVCPRPSVLDKLLAIELLFTLWCKQAPRSATDHAVIILHLASCCGSGLRTPSTLIAFVRTPNINLYLMHATPPAQASQPCTLIARMCDSACLPCTLIVKSAR